MGYPNEELEEVKIAAKWWADQLRQKPRHDNGDAMQSVFARLAAETVARPTDEQIDAFEKELIYAIRTMRGFLGDSWRPSTPMWAGSGRVVDTDYHACFELDQAAKTAGIEGIDLLLPMKTVMWINPGEVKVASGYGAPIETIYFKANGASEPSEEISAA